MHCLFRHDAIEVPTEQVSGSPAAALTSYFDVHSDVGACAVHPGIGLRDGACRAGDWQCGCGADNFSFRTACFRCDAPR